MLIQSATKKYEVSIHSSLDPVKDMAVDEKPSSSLTNRFMSCIAASCSRIFRKTGCIFWKPQR